MIVFKKNTDPDGYREYSHIECDVPGCTFVSPTAGELNERSLQVRGWYIAAGKHRCPDHFHDETEPHGPLERAADGSEGFVR